MLHKKRKIQSITPDKPATVTESDMQDENKAPSNPIEEKENKKAISPVSTLFKKKSLSIIIPKQDTIELTCKGILAGEANIRHNGNLSKDDVRYLVTALSKVKPGKIDELVLDHIFTLTMHDNLNSLIQIWDAAKTKVKILQFTECTLPEEFLDYVKIDLNSHKNAQYSQFKVLNSDILKYRSYR